MDKKWHELLIQASRVALWAICSSPFVDILRLAASRSILGFLFLSVPLTVLGAAALCVGFSEREESVEQFVRRNLGDEVFERLIEPFCSGVYAGDPSKLSMKAAFGKACVLPCPLRVVSFQTWEHLQAMMAASRRPNILLVALFVVCVEGCIRNG
jgi:Flavin containing amine oxidoreductase